MASRCANPAATRPNGVKGSLSCVAELSPVFTNTCVARPFGTANANATVPRVFDFTNASSGIVLDLSKLKSGVRGGRWTKFRSPVDDLT
jgi:hypothetical protein